MAKTGLFLLMLGVFMLGSMSWAHDEPETQCCEDGLFVARRYDLLFGKITAAGVTNLNKLPYPAVNTQWSLDIDYDPLYRMVYWSTQKKIYRANMDGSDLAVVKDNLGLEVDGIAIDWIARQLYWTDASKNTLSVCDLAGSYTKTIFPRLDKPRAVIVVIVEVYILVWTEWGDRPRIAKSYLDGSNVVTIVDNDVVWPNGLTYDEKRRVLYFADASRDKVEKVNLDGSGRTLLSASAAKHIFAISYLDNYLYYTDWTSERVMRLVVTSPSRTEDLYTSSTRPMGVKATRMTACTIPANDCAVDNGGCSHFCFCISIVIGIRCGCPDNYVLKSDRKTCEPLAIGKIILVARRFDLLYGSLTESGVSNLESLPYSTSATRYAIGIDYDPVEKFIYWSTQNKIYRAKKDGSEFKVILDGLGAEVDGIAVDCVARNLYWTDASKDTLSVSDLEGTYTRTLFKNMQNPRAIVIDSEKGMMYWTEWGSPPGIWKASLDGKNKQKIVSSTIVWPNGLALDKERRRLYFADASLDRVEEVGLDGTGRKLLSTSAAKHIYAISYCDNYLYYTDWTTEKVMSLSVTSPSNTKDIYDSDTRPMALKVSKKTCDQTNPCTTNNGGCSRFCFYTPTGVKCGCPDGDILIGGTNCI